MPRRETFTTKDRRDYPLWADIDDLASAVMPAHWSPGRDLRRQRGWMFRGHSHSEWDLVPSLYRPPCDERTLKLRADYTEAFIDALGKQGRELGLGRLTDIQYLAIAQHYGFYTELLDFTWNAEVAFHFATATQSGKVGAIFAFSSGEYEQLRNPLSPLGSSREESDLLLKRAGMEPLPDLELVELYNVPRVFEQEGIFIRVAPDKVGTLVYECIDRFYFRQRPNLVYGGNFPHREHALLDPKNFDSRRTYESYLASMRKEHPQVFDRTIPFRSATLFPPADPISKFAERWKHDHPDPSRGAAAATPAAPPPAVLPPRAERFAAQVEVYYYGDFAASPYRSEFLEEGRLLLDSLCDYPELDDESVQRWLLWELMNRNVPAGLTCTLKLGNAESWGSEQDGFQVTAVDRWLQKSFQTTLTRQQLDSGYWEISFGRFGERGRPVAEKRQIKTVALPEWRAVRRPAPANPHKGAHAVELLHGIDSRLAKLDNGIVGSFLYDLHHAVMISMGRNLTFTVGMAPSAPCFQASPMVHPEHVDGPALFVRVEDGFTGGISQTAVCAGHWDHLSEGDIDLLRPHPFTILGLA